MINLNSNSESTLKNIQKTSTIEQFVSMINAVPLDYQKLSLVENIENVRFPVNNVVSDYLNELKTLAVTIDLNEDQYRKYRYKPKLLAGDIYNNQELYYVILLLNGMTDVREFDRKSIKMLSKTDMADCLSNIYNAEKVTIESYNNK